MANIIPIMELSNNPNRISELCHSQDEPVFITKNGYGDMVIMSFDNYELLNSQAKAYLAKSKMNFAQTVKMMDDIAEDKIPVDTDQNLGGIRKLPLEDVVFILKEELKKQQLLDETHRKRFP